MLNFSREVLLDEVAVLKAQFKWARSAMMDSKEDRPKERFFDIMINTAAEIENLEARIITAPSEIETNRKDKGRQPQSIPPNSIGLI